MHPFSSGIIFRKHKGFIVVTTGCRYSMIVEDVIDKDGDNIVNELIVGDRFYTKDQDISKSIATRVNFGPNGSI